MAQLWEALHRVQGETRAASRPQTRQVHARQAHLHHNPARKSSALSSAIPPAFTPKPPQPLVNHSVFSRARYPQVFYVLALLL